MVAHIEKNSWSKLLTFISGLRSRLAHLGTGCDKASASNGFASNGIMLGGWLGEQGYFAANFCMGFSVNVTGVSLPAGPRNEYCTAPQRRGRTRKRNRREPFGFALPRVRPSGTYRRVPDAA